MAYNNSTAVVGASQAPPIVAELQSIFDRLDNAALIKALIGGYPIRRGPKGHSIKSLWRAFVTKHVLGLPSTAALIRELRNNPFVAQVCGFDSIETIPNKATFSRFFKKLSSQKFLHLVKDVSRANVRRQYETRPEFGERLALDSTTLKGWVNGGKPKPSDPDAGWSVKKGTQGKTEFTLGWKLHLAVDCETEFPTSANVSPGNVHDVTRASNLLSEAHFTYPRFNPRFVLADAGYSSNQLIRRIRRQFSAHPIIQINKAHRKLRAEFGEQMATPEWKALYTQRTAVERAFSRLKGQRSLNNITTRGLRKVTLHCYLSLIAMQAIHLEKSASNGLT